MFMKRCNVAGMELHLSLSCMHTSISHLQDYHNSNIYVCMFYIQLETLCITEQKYMYIHV